MGNPGTEWETRGRNGKPGDGRDASQVSEKAISKSSERPVCSAIFPVPQFSPQFSSGLTIYDNVFAAIPLQLELFRGTGATQFTLREKQPREFEVWQEFGPSS
jgi:hypothetical protein